jgi:hypothetical protein
MSFEYKRGHVVNVWFPNDDPKNPGLKDRPCVILSRHSDTEFKFACITGTDWSKTNRGFWIEANTKEYSHMRLSKPSFINLDDIKILPETAIRNYKGYCPKIDEIDVILKDK